MRWASSISGPEGLGRSADELERAIEECLTSLKNKLAEEPIDLLVGFISPHFQEHFENVPAIVKKHIEPKVFIGCSAGGLIGGGQEVEQQTCVAFMAAHLPDVQIKSFHLKDDSLPDLDAAPDAWEKIVGVQPAENPSFIMLPDPFTFRSDSLIQGLDYAFPKSVKIGGLASGAHAPGGNALFLNDRVYRNGLVGLSVFGNIVVDTVVAQGCKPIGSLCKVTKSKKHILFELDGQPAIMILKKTIDELSGYDRELAREHLFIGLAMDESKDKYKAGDFLVRNILGIEQNTGALVIGEVLDNARTVQFHIRDAATSADDLRFLLKDYKDDKLADGKKEAKGAILFSCLGRGSYLYGRANHDSECFRDYLGPIPLGGFFCNGEIGPVGNNTFLHGYTSSFGIFRQKE